MDNQAQASSTRVPVPSTLLQSLSLGDDPSKASSASMSASADAAYAAADAAAAAAGVTTADDDLGGLDMAFVRQQEQLYARLTAVLPTKLGKSTSIAERHAKGMKRSSLVYGEIAFEPFGITFEKIKKRYGGMAAGSGGVFYDVGSGTGKPAFAALLLHDFDRVGGVELLEGLHAKSIELVQRFDDELRLSLPEPKRRTSVNFVRGDATSLVPPNLDWSDGDVVFANSTCFDDQLMGAVARCAESMRTGAFFITFTKRLPSDCFDVLESKVYRMSWGAATVFIQKRNDRVASGSKPA